MSTTWVALVRGINVGTAKRVAMADLRALLTELGYGDVRTALNSGNAVFTVSGRAAGSTIEKAIQQAIDAELGLDVTVMARTAGELAAVVDGNPFPTADPKRLYTAFLSTKVPAAKLKSVDRSEVAPDEFEAGDRVLYLHQPNGIMGSKLPDWEKVLGVRATVRGWPTVTRLHDLASG